jgi:predicted enzyme involved in methoxymalonyl-ACP biosynthesis
MLDTPTALVSPLRDLRRKLLAKPPTLPAIFQTGDRILAATADPAAIPADLPSQRVAILGSVTIDYLSRAVACGILAEGTVPVVYQAPFGTYIQEILDPAAPLHGFAPDLALLAPDWRDLIALLPIGASAAEMDAALQPNIDLFATLWDRLAVAGSKIIQHTLVPPTAR